MMLHVTIPVEPGNKAIKDGSLPQVVQAVLQELKPEAAYFTPVGGLRSAFIVFDMNDSSDLPRIAEPLFQGFNAKVEFSPVMNADDLRTGLSKIRP